MHVLDLFSCIYYLDKVLIRTAEMLYANCNIIYFEEVSKSFILDAYINSVLENNETISILMLSGITKHT